jgi:hypothetical protein
MVILVLVIGRTNIMEENGVLQNITVPYLVVMILKRLCALMLRGFFSAIVFMAYHNSSGIRRENLTMASL